MKKFLLVFAGMALAGTFSVPARTIYGYQTWQPDTEAPKRGPVKFDPAATDKLELIADQSGEGVVYGGYYLDYHWFGQVTNKGTQSSIKGFYDIDLATGERKLIAAGGSKLLDMTYDYVTKTVYGVKSGNQWLATLNPKTGEVSNVGKFAINGADVFLIAIAANLDGTLYGVTTDDNLVKIDPKTAALTVVGQLGVDAGFDQTMSFDHNDGKLYWYNNGDYMLYTIDVATGKATAVGSLAYDGCSTSLGSMVVPYINVPAGAPDRVTGARVQGASTSATLTWTCPSTTVRGEKLTDLGGVIVLRDGEKVADVTNQTVGGTGTYTDNGLEGNKVYEYELVPYNAAGNGGSDYYRLSVLTGADRPGMVGDLKAEAGDGSAILSWTAPTAGANNGIFDVSDITGYEVKRGTKVVATVEPTQLTYEDKTSFGVYTYSVAAVSKAGKGDPAVIEDVTVKPEGWIIMSDGEEKVAPGKEYTFYDDGGPQSNYTNSRNLTLTIAPSTDKGYVSVAFSKLDIESYDNLAVYQGRGTSGELVGKFNGSSVPAQLKQLDSNAADGCLTFVFTSDVMENYSGWTASVRCLELADCDLEATALAADAIAIAEKNTVAKLTIANKGVASVTDYKIELLDGVNAVATVDGPAVASRASVTVDVPFVPTTAGTMNLSARLVVDGDSNSANNVAGPVEVKVLPAGSVVADVKAENGSDLYILPASFMAIESISETILYASDLAVGKGLDLSVITFTVSQSTNGYENVPFALWVGETDDKDLVAGTIPASKLTKVFDGKIDVPVGCTEQTFSFETPYAYKGGNLVYMLHKKASNASNSGVTYLGSYGYDNARPNVTRYDSKWSADSETVIDPEVSFGYSAQNMIPDVRLIFSSNQGGVDDVTVAPAQSVVIEGTTVTALKGARIYDGAGRLAAIVEAGGSVTLPAGLYIVATPAGSVKAVLK
ncbi:MAG: hypothetical protein K2K84_04560 [Muribaculaceae bacterium]|nr:hypothetical protein [Muribaculaceae bacterium]